MGSLDKLSLDFPYEHLEMSHFVVIIIELVGSSVKSSGMIVANYYSYLMNKVNVYRFKYNLLFVDVVLSSVFIKKKEH